MSVAPAAALNWAKPAEFPLPATIVLFALACLVLAWPWLSGAVTIPWDAKSQFLPQVRFLAGSLARGESPFWTPNVFAGWPQIADPQSLIFSPLHVLLAGLDPNAELPRDRRRDLRVSLPRRARHHPLFPRPRLACGRRAGRGDRVRVRRLGQCALQHTGQIISLAYLPLTLLVLSRALERKSWRLGALAGVLGALMAIGRDQVALIGLYVLAGYVAWHWADGERRTARLRASIAPLAAAAVAGLLVAAVPIVLSALLAADSNRPEFGFVFAGRGSLHPAHLLMLVFPDLYGASDPNVDHWGPPSLDWSNAWGWPGLYLAQNMGQVYAGALTAVAIFAFGIVRGLLWAREIRFFTVATLVVLLYALGWYTPAFQLDVRHPARRDVVSAVRPTRPSCSAPSWRSSPATWCIAGSPPRCRRRGRGSARRRLPAVDWPSSWQSASRSRSASLPWRSTRS